MSGGTFQGKIDIAQLSSYLANLNAPVCLDSQDKTNLQILTWQLRAKIKLILQLSITTIDKKILPQLSLGQSVSMQDPQTGN